MKRFLASMGICTLFLLVLGVFASSVSSQAISNSSQEGTDEVAHKFVKNFVEKRDIKPEDISNISEVNFNELPKDVDIKNIGKHNLAIYKIDYKEEPKKIKNKIFVVAYSVKKMKSRGDLLAPQSQREFLGFGFSGTSKGSRFLSTATGIETSLEKGYVMMRSGSITGVSTNLEIVDSAKGSDVRIIIYKNGKEIRFGNNLHADAKGVRNDYDIQSQDIIKFEPGDVISVYLKTDGKVVWKDANTLVEITV